jgi:hypothetical protein
MLDPAMATRPRQPREDYTARFPPGTLARLEAALRGRETKADLIRQAVEEKLQQRERQNDRKGAKR